MSSWTTKGPWTSTSSDYHPSLEWPGSDADLEHDCQTRSAVVTQAFTSLPQICLRLVVKSSAVLARKRRIAVLDAYEEAQIGRDASLSEDIPRIRLKDLEVSKLHATLFWDRERKEWAIVDMGSKHGTFVKSSRNTANGGEDDALSDKLDVIAPDPAFVRLSPPRQASMPRALRHSDELSIGRTIFVVHVHSNGLPCDECRSEGELDIPLFSVSSIGRTQTQKSSELEVVEEKQKVQRDAKSAMSLLKKSLLSRHSDTSYKTEDRVSQPYIDRSAKRRALHPYSRPSSPPPGVSSRTAASLLPSTRNISSSDTARASAPLYTSSSGANFVHDPSQSSTVSAPPAPISDANVGHRLLEKQGWVPGSTLGAPTARSNDAFNTFEGHPIDQRMALSEPLQVSANIGRRGLGMPTKTFANTSDGTTVGSRTGVVGDWRVDSRRRRWDDLGRSVL